MLWYNISLYESILHTLRRAYIASSLGILYNTMGLQVCKYSTAKLDGSLSPDNHLIEQTLKLTQVRQGNTTVYKYIVYIKVLKNHISKEISFFLGYLKLLHTTSQVESTGLHSHPVLNLEFRCVILERQTETKKKLVLTQLFLSIQIITTSSLIAQGACSIKDRYQTAR